MALFIALWRTTIRFYRGVAPSANELALSQRPAWLIVGIKGALTFGLALIFSAALLCCDAEALPQKSLPLAEVTETTAATATTALETATKSIREGLERTQRDIGKTEARSAAIEHGRDRAVAKLKGLLERLEAAESLEDLSDTDRLTLERLAS